MRGDDGRILAAVRYSDAGLDAVRRAGRLARRHAARLTVALLPLDLFWAGALLPIGPPDLRAEHAAAASRDIATVLDPLGVRWSLVAVDRFADLVVLVRQLAPRIVVAAAHAPSWRAPLRRRRELADAAFLARRVQAPVQVWTEP